MTKEEANSLCKSIIEQVDIVDFIGHYTSLKYNGKEWVGVCPLHKGDTDPSFFVNAEKKVFKCFGCNVGGTVVSFYMAIKNVNYYVAVKELSKQIGIKCEFKPQILMLKDTLKNKTQKIQDRIYLIDNCMEEFENNHAIKEWMEEGISEEILSKHNVRYSLDKTQILFPILDYNGKIIAIKCRNLTKKPKYIYLNKIGNKNFLYNYNFAKENIEKKNECIVVESEKSCMKLEGFGFFNSVAVGCHCMSEEESNILIKTKFENLVFAYDEDVELTEIKKQIKNIRHYKNVYYIPTNGLNKKNSPVDEGYNKWIELYKNKSKIWG